MKGQLVKMENKTVLITGANRGIGRALVDEALNRTPTQAESAGRFIHVDEQRVAMTEAVCGHR